MNRILITAAITVLFVAGARAGDGKDRIDRRDGVVETYRSHIQMQEGRASLDGQKPAFDLRYDPRREDDR
jgi:hypothetical protein